MANTVFTNIKAGPASLHIWAIRYRFFIRDLELIIRKDKDDWALIRRDISDLVDANPKFSPHLSLDITKERLETFVRLLLWSGQNIEDWNIPLNDTALKFKRHSNEM